MVFGSRESVEVPNTSTGSDSANLVKHVWEHLTYEEGVRAAHICFEFLKLGGYVRCAVPDSFFPDTEYQRIVQVGGPEPKDHPAASHKIVYNYRTLTQMFEETGFETSLLEYCDENGQFHYRHWEPDDGVLAEVFSVHGFFRQ